MKPGVMTYRPEKIAMREELRSRVETSGYVFFADCRGMTVDGMTDLRKRLRGSHSRLMIVRNALLSLASRDLGWNDVDRLLEGPTAMITGTGDVAQVAKLLRDFAKTSKQTQIKGGRFAAQTLSAEDVQELADTPPREVLYARLAGTLAAPMTQLVGVLQQKNASLVYVLKAVADKKAENA